jgi:hypothetical protein
LNLESQRVKLGPRRTIAIPWPKSETEPIPHVTRNDVQMDVEHLLACGLPVGQEKVNAFALDAAMPEGSGDPLGHTKHVPPRLLVKLRQ